METTREDKPIPRVGVAVIVWQDASRSRFLLGLGHSASDRNKVYAVPGGHWESGETLIDAARRETAEEAGVEIAELRLISVYDFFNADKGRSYVTIGFEAFLVSGVPRVMEPENKASWDWCSPSQALSLPLFLPDKVLIERAVSGVVFVPSGG